MNMRWRLGMAAGALAATGFAIGCSSSSGSGAGGGDDASDDGASADGSMQQDSTGGDAPPMQGGDGAGNDGGSSGDSTVSDGGGGADSASTDGGSSDGTTSDHAAPGDGGSGNEASSGDGGDAGGPDAGPNEAGSADSSSPEAAACAQVETDAYAACNSVCNLGPVVPISVSTQPVPAATGGALVPGIYYVTAYTSFCPADAGVEAGVSSQTIQETASFSPPDPVGVSLSVQSSNGGPDETSTIQFAAVGSSIYLTETCPGTGQLAIPYSASSGQFRAYLPGKGPGGQCVDEQVLTLQSAFDAGPPPVDAGAGDAGTCVQALSDAQAACNSVCNSAPLVQAVGDVGTAPTPTGGTIADGTYYQTAKIEWGSADAGYDGGALFTARETIVISTSGGVSIWQDIQSSSGKPYDTATISVVTSGTTAYLTGICPQGAQGTRGYSVIGNTLHVFEATSNGVVEETVLTQQ